MKDVSKIRDFQRDYVLDTGSPHYVKIVQDVMDINVYEKGKEIR